MFIQKDNLINSSVLNEIKDNLFQGKIGVEKESLRFNSEGISKLPHFKIFGNALCNQYITTDFSDAQLELITPPLGKFMEVEGFLNNIHSYVVGNIPDEYLWPFSMPFRYQSDEEIPIAYYGQSNQAEFKHTYRRGLANRYGRIMQTISGVHINYSFSSETIGILNQSLGNKEENQLESIVYFRMLRNIHRYGWLIAYLFGSSPIVSKDFISDKYEFSKLDQDYFYLPYATSLRMSDLGYQNTDQSSIGISLDNIDEYSNDLKEATKKKSKKFEKIKDHVDGEAQQLNKSYLQIEDEYYSPARPKNSDPSTLRLSSKLKSLGTNYLELRNFDLNPFSSIGINKDDLRFVELFLIFCSLYKSEAMSPSELKEARHNELLVSTEGRNPDLQLSKNGEPIGISDWAKKIINEMEKIINHSKAEPVAMKNYSDQISDPTLTRSSKFLRKVLDNKGNYLELGLKIAKQNKSEFLKTTIEKNPLREILDDEVQIAKRKEKELSQETISFDEYLSNYYSS
tara:strand:+ start:2880 stop:4418 length:1539 start_codon:yes stop_codon:yes gene_type:complete